MHTLRTQKPGSSIETPFPAALSSGGLDGPNNKNVSPSTLPKTQAEGRAAGNARSSNLGHSRESNAVERKLRKSLDEFSMDDPFTLNVQDICIDTDDAPLGQGNYGVVHKGTLGGTTVAVKTMLLQHHDQDQHSSNRLQRRDFLKEINFLRKMQCLGGHHNVIRLVGYTTAGRMVIVTEFAAQGSLLSFLRKAGPRKYNLSDRLMITFALGIARGMDFIAAHQMVHRDLAARNVSCVFAILLAFGSFSFSCVSELLASHSLHT